MVWLSVHGQSNEPRVTTRFPDLKTRYTLGPRRAILQIMQTTTAPSATEFMAALPAALALRGRDSSSTSDVRFAIRRDLKTAQAAGLLPKGAGFSVRGDYSSITVEIVAWTGVGPVLSAAYAEAVLADALGDPVRLREFPEARSARVSDSLISALSLIERIANRHNYDNSRSEEDYFDVGYYLHVEAERLISLAVYGTRDAANPAAAARRSTAKVAAARLGKAVTRSVCGSTSLDAIGEYAMERLLRLDAMADGRPLRYSKTSGRWVVEASAATKITEARS